MPRVPSLSPKLTQQGLFALGLVLSLSFACDAPQGEAPPEQEAQADAPDKATGEIARICSDLCPSTLTGCPVGCAKEALPLSLATQRLDKLRQSRLNPSTPAHRRLSSRFFAIEEMRDMFHKFTGLTALLRQYGMNGAADATHGAANVLSSALNADPVVTLLQTDQLASAATQASYAWIQHNPACLRAPQGADRTAAFATLLMIVSELADWLEAFPETIPV